MPKFSVTMPIAGFAYLEVDADNDRDALEKFYEQCDLSVGGNSNIEELEYYERLVSGNVCHTYHTEVEVYEVDN